MGSVIVGRDRCIYIVGEDGRAKRRCLSGVFASSDGRLFVNLRLDLYEIVYQLSGIIILNECRGYVGTRKFTIIVVFGDRLTLNVKTRVNRFFPFTAGVDRGRRSAVYRVGEGQRVVFHFIDDVAGRRSLIAYALVRQIFTFCAAISINALLVSDERCAAKVAFGRMLAFNMPSFLGCFAYCGL